MFEVSESVVRFLTLGMFAIVGLICIALAVNALKTPEQEAKFGTAAFWSIVGIAFIFGDWIPPVMVGIMVVILALLSATKQVRFGKFEVSSDADRQAAADRIKGKLFVPALILAIVSFAVAQWTNLGAVNAVGLGGLAAWLFMLIVARTTVSQGVKEATRILSQVGPMSILPQVLAALGSLFTAAGVGTAISSLVGAVVPEGNIWFGVIAYCLGMALFTMIMGNGFAAFAVMTAGIGIPFVFANGADPLVASALAMTAGFCGTLLTPMAANFNIVPAALLEMKDKYGVIKAQAPVAIILLIAHIFLMRFLAF